ncbi:MULTISPECIES: hypothetical protein [Novosphingobium]|uniref:DUF4164 family protein n=1 Tax=Novosphingobium decolorationis TaxID=2698673 RepID=A0ABX8E2U7_9SPHN|nr:MULTISPECIES: hypothetical protein [Novosphingobium]MED5545613.1 hypothetical protein [Pseudomonadota bacterium]QVM82924.1 hypothetical protein HT578_03680 [Novosphingobium decolorationis]GAM06384.1 hypothetical protein MBENS4_3381 [Novosphingobium sp. MBES04]
MEETETVLPAPSAETGEAPDASPLARIEAALARIESACAHRLRAEDALLQRHGALRARVEETLGELDTLIEGSAP